MMILLLNHLTQPLMCLLTWLLRVILFGFRVVYQHIPLSFWVVCLNRLSTLDRLINQKFCTNFSYYLFSQKGDENVHHLFVSSQYKLLIIDVLQVNHVSNDKCDMICPLFTYYYYNNFLLYIVYCINIL